MLGIYGTSVIILYMPPFPPQNGNASSHQHKSISKLQQMNHRTPKIMPLLIKNKYPHSSLPSRKSTTVLDRSTPQDPPIPPNNTQHYGKPSRHGSNSANKYSLQMPNPISDHL